MSINIIKLDLFGANAILLIFVRIDNENNLNKLNMKILWSLIRN